MVMKGCTHYIRKHYTPECVNCHKKFAAAVPSAMYCQDEACQRAKRRKHAATKRLNKKLRAQESTALLTFVNQSVNLDVVLGQQLAPVAKGDAANGMH